ncbi:hypothetical protein [Pseudomonas sp. Pse1]|uniref:hypothetical protein n=1 Tax=Pseudomonas sp. Pse1 TaxID=2926020 RepID=UPI0021188B0A|nr:hypothetical protein [Pseudomonas sp. Pse1]
MSTTRENPSKKPTGSSHSPAKKSLPAPVMEWPKDGAVHDGAYVRCAGTCEDGAQVEMSEGSTWVAVPTIGKNWSTTFKDMTAGGHRISVRQTLDGVISAPGPTVTFIVRTPTIAAPGVTVPETKVTYAAIDEYVSFSGPHEPGDIIYIRDVDDNLLGTANVDGAFWYFQHSWQKSEIVYVKITRGVNGGLSRVAERWIAVGLIDQSLKVTVTNPWKYHSYTVEGYVEYEGECTPVSHAGTYVFVSDPRSGREAFDGIMVGDRWKVRVGPIPLIVDYHQVVCTDADKGIGKASEPITPFPGERLPTPLISKPLSGSTHPAGLIEIAGDAEGTPRELFLLSAEGDELRTLSVANGKWSDFKEWAPGTYAIKVVSKVNGPRYSDQSEIVRFTVV